MALGAQTVAPQRRTILLIGDGAALLTAQEIGTRLREGRKPLVVVISNDAIHGPAERYNDIPQWNWPLMPAAMGGEPARVLRAGTLAELTTALQTAADPQGLVLLEAVLPKTVLPKDGPARGPARAHPRPGRCQRPGSRQPVSP